MSFLKKFAKVAGGASLGGIAGGVLGAKHGSKPKAKVAPVVRAANAQGIDTRSRTSTVQPNGSKPKPKMNLAQKSAASAKAKGSLVGFKLR